MNIFKQWWWNSTGKRLHKITWQGIKNLFRWFPLVWKDRDYDYSYIFYTLKFKIQNTADYIEKHKRYEGYERDVERMRLCVKLIDLLQDDYYQSEYQDYYETEFYTNEQILQSNIIRDDLDSYFAKYPNDYRKLPEKYKDSTKPSKALIMGGMRHTKATKILFTIIERNIYYWWD